MNQNLSERFGRSRSAFKPAGEQVEVWIQPQQLNEGIRRYFEEPASPVIAGDWTNRAEIPTTAEILDEDTSSSSGSANTSSEVVIVPNKRKGAWASKGMPNILALPLRSI